MTEQEETNLEHTLINSQKDDWVSYIATHPKEFSELIQLSISDKQPYSWRASWLLSSCMDNNDQRVKRHIHKIIEIVPARQNSQQRALLKVLQRMEIEPKYEGQLFEICTKIWQNIKNNPSLRFQSFKILVVISNKHLSLKSELKLLTDDYYTGNLSDILKKSIFKLIRNDLK